MIPVATPALSDSASPMRGMVTWWLQQASKAALIPFDSFPITITPFEIGCIPVIGSPCNVAAYSDASGELAARSRKSV